MYQLIALDVDGTLLNSKKKITSAVKQAIETALENGKDVAISSGRCLAELDEILAELPKIRYLICTSGAMVYDIQQQKEIYSNQLQPQNILDILNHVEGRDVLIQLMSHLSIVDIPHGSNLEKYGMGIYQTMFNRVCTFVDDTIRFYRNQPTSYQKLNLYHTSIEERNKSLSLLKDMNVSIKFAESAALEISAQNVNKGIGLIKLCEYLDIPIHQTIAVGDADNDLEILQTAGLAIAMGNASDHIKQAAHKTTLDNDHDGVAHVIHTYLLDKN